MEIVAASVNLTLGFLIAQIGPLYPKLGSIFRDYNRLPVLAVRTIQIFGTNFPLGKSKNLD